MLVVTAGVSAFFGLLVAGWYTAAFWYLAGSGICMMAVDVAVGRVSRGWATGLLLVGVCYAAANIAVFMVAMSIDAFLIFRDAYIIPAVFVTPPLLAIAATVAAVASKKLAWLGVLGFVVWVGCVGFAHFWVIVQCSASV
jgi:hypothetical protein